MLRAREKIHTFVRRQIEIARAIRTGVDGAANTTAAPGYSDIGVAAIHDVDERDPVAARRSRGR